MRSPRTVASAGIATAFAFGLVFAGTASASTNEQTGSNEAASAPVSPAGTASLSDILLEGLEGALVRTGEVPWT